jgi:hypothetical protein
MLDFSFKIKTVPIACWWIGHLESRVAQTGTGWQLFRRSPSPISKARNGLASPGETGWYSRRRRGFGTGTKWREMALFPKVPIADLQDQKEFRANRQTGRYSRRRHGLALRIGMASTCGILGPFSMSGSSIPVSLVRWSETGAATLPSVKHSERTEYPFYLYCTVCCGFVKAPAPISRWIPIRAFCPDWT